MGEAINEDSCPRLEAFVLVTVAPGSLWKVVEEARKIKGVSLVRAVGGRFDVIIKVDTNNLSWVIARIQSLKGLSKAETLVSLEAHF